MYQKFAKALVNLHRGQRGMTGLETAIILIAFVTVASVLAYSVLSAGIFSAEKGKETVYSGLEQAQSTMEVKGSVLGISTDNSTLASLQVTLALSIPGQAIDSSEVVFNYWDADNHTEGITATSFAISSGSTERGNASFIEQDEQFILTLPLANTPATYETFTVQIVPPTGATLTIGRTVPGKVVPVTSLQ